MIGTHDVSIVFLVSWRLPVVLSSSPSLSKFVALMVHALAKKHLLLVGFQKVAKPADQCSTILSYKKKNFNFFDIKT